MQIIEVGKELKDMSNIKYILDWKNLTMAEAEEKDRYCAVYALFSKLKASEERANKEGWISADDVEKELGVY